MTKPGGTAKLARANSPKEPPLPPTDARSASEISANQRMFGVKCIAHCSNVELFIDRNPVLAAIALVVIDEPPHIEGFHEATLVIVELNWSLQPSEQLDAIGMV